MLSTEVSSTPYGNVNMGRGQESDSIIMTNTIENLILDLLEWIGRRERTYQETLDAWRTSCPRLPVWEDANDRCLVERVFVDSRFIVRVTSAGFALLEEKRPSFFAESSRQG